MIPLKKLTLIVFLVASCSLVWQFYRMHRAAVQSQRLYEEYGVIVCTMGPSTDERARTFIEFLLALALIGSRLKGLKNTLPSVIALSGTLIIYIFWWQTIFRIARNAETSVDAIPHYAYLVGGNVLDVGIAAAVVVLVLLNVTRAVIILRQDQIDSN
jgi:hypothetical protein